MQNKFYLSKEMFTEREKLILENGNMKAYTFLFSTGICGVRVENENGYIVVLPYQGQQIWRASFLGHDLVMRTAFEEPRTPETYLSTYGGFLLHCGINAMGAPSKEDTHPQHGEIPNVEYTKAFLISGEDENGKYISVAGEYNKKVAFVQEYVFAPECRLYEKATVIEEHINITNNRSKAMEYMYLCHINFRPEDGSELVYSAEYNKENVKVHKIVPETLPADHAKKLKDYMDAIQEDITIHNKVDYKSQCYDPEICFAVKYKADDEGYGHTMQYLPDGYAHYVAHPTAVLPVGVRWVSIGADEESMGMVLPATSEHLGYIHAKKLGQVKILEGKSTLSFTIKTGLLAPNEAKSMKKKINDMMGR